MTIVLDTSDITMGTQSGTLVMRLVSIYRPFLEDTGRNTIYYDPCLVTYLVRDLDRGLGLWCESVCLPNI